MIYLNDLIALDKNDLLDKLVQEQDLQEQTGKKIAHSSVLLLMFSYNEKRQCFDGKLSSNYYNDEQLKDMLGDFDVFIGKERDQGEYSIQHRHDRLATKKYEQEQEQERQKYLKEQMYN